MPIVRTRTLAAAAVGALAAAGLAASCTRSPSSEKVLGGTNPSPSSVIATFEGSVDPATGTMTIRMVPATDPAALTVFPTLSDGNAASNPDNTLQIRTVSSGTTGSNPSCGGARTFDGAIELRSFFVSQTFTNVYVELTDVDLSNYYGCNGTTATQYGLGSTFGLWSYGTLGPKGSTSPSDTVATTWSFSYPSDAYFTFHGHVVGQLGRPVYAGGPEFDWNPMSLVMPTVNGPQNSFVEHTGTGGTTLAHVVWNGTNFVDTLGHITNFQEVGAPGTTPIGLWTPGGSYAGPFPAADASHPAGNFYQSTSDPIDTSGTFTICVKFKPGVHAQFHSTPAPGYWDPTKILVAKGQPEPNENPSAHGWAVMQMHGEYCFHYRTSADTGSDVMSFMSTDTATPELFTYDYECGGRVGNIIRVGVHGIVTGPDVAETGTLTSIGSMPLTIGAYPDGSEPLFDGGVYEFIIDSRAPTQAVMNEIVDEAEGRYVFSTSRSSHLPGLYEPPTVSSGTQVTGVDGGTYTAPVYGTVPLASDGTGLLAAGTTVKYVNPSATNTSSGGYCVGAEVTSTGPWSSVTGGVVDIGGNGFTLWPMFLMTGDGPWTGADTPSDWGTTAWDPGTRHKFTYCMTTGGSETLYVDDVPSTPVTGVHGTITNMATATVIIGSLGGNTLQGARIGRVFICPSANQASCL